MIVTIKRQESNESSPYIQSFRYEGTLGNCTRFSKDKNKVIEAIVNLYLKKQIVFE